MGVRAEPPLTHRPHALGQALLREWRTARQQRWGNLWGYLFITPALVLYLVFNLWPMVRGFLMAFTDYRFLIPTSRWEWNGLENFREMTTDKVFWESLAVSLKYTLMVVPTMIFIALIVSVLIARIRRGAAFYRWLFYLPTIIPIAVSMLMWREMYNNQFGYINNTLRWLGVTNPPNWFGDPRWALPALAAADVWRSFGFPMLLFLIGLYSISHDLYEASEIDGANFLDQTWHITLPLLKPVFVLVLVLHMHILGATEQILLTTNGGPQNATRTLGFYLYNVAFTEGDLRLGYAAAIALTLGLISAALTLVTVRLLRTEAA